MSINPAREAQLALLLTKKVTVPIEYSDFTNVFSEKSANVLLEQTRANAHAIELEEGRQPLYKPILPGAGWAWDPQDLYWDQLGKWVYPAIEVINGCSNSVRSQAWW